LASEEAGRRRGKAKDERRKGGEREGRLGEGRGKGKK
jgi:hypothetical protein